MTALGAPEGEFLGGRLVVWVPVAALREHRLRIDIGRQLHTLVRAIPHQMAADLHRRAPAAGLAGWEVTAAGTGAQGQARRLSGQVDGLFTVSCRYTRQLQQWQPDLTTLTANPADSTADKHPARHNWPASGDPVLIGHLITLTGARTDAVLH